MAGKKSVHKKTIITEVVEKKPAKKKTAHKKSTRKKTTPKKDNSKIESALAENFVSFQKVMVNLSVKFDDLTKQISKLLDLFEISAKALAEKDVDLEKNVKDVGAMDKKLDNLLDQNKIIARGLTLMHDKISGEEQSAPMVPPQMSPPQMPPRMQAPETPAPMRKINPLQKPGMDGYEKSLS